MAPPFSFAEGGALLTQVKIAAVEAAFLAKATTPLLSLAMLGVLAGAFIGVGSLFYTIVARRTRCRETGPGPLVYDIVYRRPARA
jgi:formate/nitrite transporter FocA (FNT family)